MGSAHLRAVKAARQKQNVLQNKEKVLWLNAEKKLAEQKVTERPKEKLAEEAKQNNEMFQKISFQQGKDSVEPNDWILDEDLILSKVGNNLPNDINGVSLVFQVEAVQVEIRGLP